MYVDQKLLKRFLSEVEKPARYIGNEINSAEKTSSIKALDPNSLGWVFAFPETYEIGMDNLGLQILYNILNKENSIYCERTFAPWVDMEALMRSNSMELFTLETKRLVKTFDIFAFTLPYEIILSNVVNMIDLSGLPLLAKDRDERYPLVIGGGAFTVNPEPIADFFDFFVIGEGEDVVLEISNIVTNWKISGKHGGKSALLKEISLVEGVYVPSFFEINYTPTGNIESIIPKHSFHKRTLRRIVADLDTAQIPLAPIVPSMQSIHNRLAVEIARGCTAGCRFCQAGMITRPTRERNPKTILDSIDIALSNTGYEEVSLNSLSSGDYSCINSLLKTVNERYSSEMLTVAIPSLRVKTLSPEIAKEIAKVRKGGFTVAPEAGSQRMRDAINKDVTEGELISTVETVFSNGGQSLKLYFMCGLPGEKDEDLDAIVNMGILAYRTARRYSRNPSITLSISTFVPKPFTPYQWASQVSREETIRKQRLLKSQLRFHRYLNLRYHENYSTFLEGVFSRGDRRLSEVLLVAHKLGCRFDGWQECIRQDLWSQAFDISKVDPLWYLRERSLEEKLPWDHIEARVTKKFLKKEWFRHCDTLTVPNCRWGECPPCGSCHKDVKTTTYDGQDSRNNNNQIPAEGRTYRHPVAVFPNNNKYDPTFNVQAKQNAGDSLQNGSSRKIRFRYEKLGTSSFLGHLETANLFFQSFRRIQLELKYTKGFHPSPKVVFSNPLSIGVESLHEFIEVDVLEKSLYDLAKSMGLPCDIVLDDCIVTILEYLKNILNDRQLPDGIRISSAVFVTKPLSPPDDMTYSCILPAELTKDEIVTAIESFRLKDDIVLEKKKSKVVVNPLVKNLEYKNSSELEFTLLTPQSGTIKPMDMIKILFPDLNIYDLRIVKTNISWITPCV